MDPNNAGNAAPPAGAPDATGKTGDTQPAATQAGHTVPLSELMKEREQRQAMQAEVEALKATVSNLANTRQAPQAPPQVNQDREELEMLWRDNPRAAMQKEMMMAMTWRDNVEATVDSSIAEAGKKYADFGNYAADVKQYIRSLPVNQRGNPGVIDAAYFMVKGSKAEDIIKAEVEARIKKLTGADMSQTFSGGTSGGGDGQPKTTILNAQQKQIASAMGMSEEDYMKHMR